MLRLFSLLIACVLTVSFAVAAPSPLAAETRSVLMLGDSMFAWNRLKGGGVGKHLRRELKPARVRDQSRTGAHMTTPGTRDGDGQGAISNQYVPGNWDWVVMNGGANDLLFECGCGKCGRVMQDMVSANLAQGALIDLINAARADGAKILLVGYHTGYSGGHFFSGCRQDVTELVARYRALAARNADIYFVSARDALDSKNRSHFALDRVHPSIKGSKRIARLIALGIAQADGS